MTSGRTFSRKIDEAITSLNAEVGKVSSQIDQLNREKAKAHARIGEAFMGIAKVQAGALKAEEISASDILYKGALQVIERRSESEASLHHDLTALVEQLQVREGVEHQAQAQRDAAAGRVQEICRQVDAELENDAAHRALTVLAVDAGTMAQAARIKAAAAAEERNAKSGAYQNDPIFTYLLKRGFGMAGYRASAMVRTIDGWLARLCGYDKALRDYDALTVLPDYLDVHAKTMEQSAVDAGDRVTNSRRAALEKAQIETAESRLAAEEATLSAAAADVDRTEDEIQSIRSEISRHHEWKDAAGAQVLESLSNAFGGERLEQLQARVAATGVTEDDALLQEILGLRTRIEELENELVVLNGELRLKKKRTEELSGVRSRFRSKDYHSSDYTIRGSSASDLLTGYIAGSVLSSDLWRGIERSASYDPPDTSSSSSSSSSPFGGGGGFSSGGGFGGGGGGFSTGGGF